MKKLIFNIICCTLLVSCQTKHKEVTYPDTIQLTKEELLDKIKGGWAGQAIGVTFGSVTEFKFNGTFIQDYQPIAWYEGYVKDLMHSWPDLYDDIYMDLTFVEVFERLGLEAPADSFAYAFAHADYVLWHANQAARYNILSGIKAPECGHWKNNPHADDIDYQIESDYAGLMSPGMVNQASEISDKIGHIMCYGDGWYGGVYVGAMYALAFVFDDIEVIVTEALKTIPKESTYYQCIADVIKWYRMYPDDWHQTWFEIQRKWSEDLHCPEGTFVPFNIDAKLNSAYVVLGLLYGRGDYTRTMEISTRSGQDSDCNPSTAGGILGTMIGYKNIPEYWMKGLKDAENINFKYTSMSLNKTYELSYKHALQVIAKNGGIVEDNNVTLNIQKPKTVRLEQSFEGITTTMRKPFWRQIEKEIEFEFTGTGIGWRGEAIRNSGITENYVFDVEFYIDDKKVEESKLYTDYKLRKYDLFWIYNLPYGTHKIKMVINNPSAKHSIYSNDYIVHDDKKTNKNENNEKD